MAGFNPLVGIGISLAGWAAGVGTKASVSGTEYLGVKIRKWAEEKSERAVEKKAAKVIRSLNPEIYENPNITELERIAFDQPDDYDPILDCGNGVDAFTPRQYYFLTTTAISGVYDSQESIDSLSPLHRAWVESLNPTE